MIFGKFWHLEELLSQTNFYLSISESNKNKFWQVFEDA